MTLIVSAHGEGLLTVSDLMISRPGSYEQMLVGRPSHPAAENLIAGGSTMVGLRQKAVQFDANHLLLWAGSEIVATHISRFIADSLKVGDDLSLHDYLIATNLPDRDIETTSLIYHRPATDGQTHVDYSRVHQMNIDGHSILYSGSGSFNFIDDIRPSFVNNEGNSENMTSWLQRVAFAFTTEFYNRETIQYAYGGWFELGRSFQGKIEKVPYLIKLWQVDGNQLTSLPCFMSWYSGSILCVGRADFKKNDANPTISITGIRDLLTETSILNTDDVLASYQHPIVQLHVVARRSDDRLFIFTEPGDWEHLRIRVGEGLATITLGSGLPAALARKIATPTVGTIVRPFSGDPFTEEELE